MQMACFNIRAIEFMNMRAGTCPLRLSSLLLYSHAPRLHKQKETANIYKNWQHRVCHGSIQARSQTYAPFSSIIIMGRATSLNTMRKTSCQHLHVSSVMHSSNGTHSRKLELTSIINPASGSATRPPVPPFTREVWQVQSCELNCMFKINTCVIRLIFHH